MRIWPTSEPDMEMVCFDVLRNKYRVRKRTRVRLRLELRKLGNSEQPSRNVSAPQR
jgi:hypothetical protein